MSVFQDLHHREIAFSISSFGNGGRDLRFGDDLHVWLTHQQHGKAVQ